MLNPIQSIAIDEKNGNIACGSNGGLCLYNVNGEMLASVSLFGTSGVTSVCFVDAQFTVLGAVALVTGHADGVIRMFRVDCSNAKQVKSGFGEQLDDGSSSSQPMILTEVYAYTAHSAAVTALLMLPDGQVSGDAEGKIVRAFDKEMSVSDWILKNTFE